MDKSIEEICYDLYKSITPEQFKKVVPLINWYRKTKKKPPIPLREKMAEINYPALGDNVIMLHGVSVGEVLSLDNLIKRIKKDFPEHKLVLTTGTVTGQQIAYKKYGEIVDYITYFPLDIMQVCERFLTKINPKIVMIAETELWPNFACACKKKNIPLYIINGRISDKSFANYSKIKNFLRLIFANYAGVFCQSDLDLNRFVMVGSGANKTEVMKNLKFEIEKQECDFALGHQHSKLLIAGSTHKGEDEIILNAYTRLRTKLIDLKLIIAPRHLERLPEIKKLLSDTKFRVGLRTKKDTFKDKDIIILDTLGELSKVYSLVDVAFIGGSFNSTGGHNPLEATIHNKPVISGPNVKNFKDIYAILEREQAAFVVHDPNELYMRLEKLFYYEDFYAKTSNNCAKCFENQQGALDFLSNKLKKILSDNKNASN